MSKRKKKGKKKKPKKNLGKRTKNIGGSKNDEFHRYKTYDIAIRNSSSKTIITNLFEICSDLNRLPIYMLRYFAVHFSCPHFFDEENEVGILKGKISKKKMEEKFDLFLKEFVLCSCGSPETRMVLSSNKKEIEMYCRASGCCEKVNVIGKSKKFLKFVVGNPDLLNKKFGQHAKDEEEMIKLSTPKPLFEVEE